MRLSAPPVNPSLDEIVIPRILDARCKGCSKLLARNLTGSVEIVCGRCQVFNTFRA